MLNIEYSKEDKKRYIEKVTQWRSELVRYRDFNVYYHPDKPMVPYRKSYNNGYIKMVRWNVDVNGMFKVMKENESYTLNVEHLDKANIYKTPMYEPDMQPDIVTVQIPATLKDAFNKWLLENVGSPF